MSRDMFCERREFWVGYLNMVSSWLEYLPVLKEREGISSVFVCRLALVRQEHNAIVKLQIAIEHKEGQEPLWQDVVNTALLSC